MDWYIYIIIGAVVLLAIYKISYRGANKAAEIIGQELNIKPVEVALMINQMPPDRAAEFTRYVCQGAKDDLELGVRTFFVYQLLKNDHPENVKWWQNRLEESGYSKKLDSDDVQVVFTYLKNMGVDITKSTLFVNGYNSKYMRS